MGYATIGLIGAMDEEIQLILASIQDISTVETAGIRYYSGVYQGKQTVLCKSGVGKVNAAICTQILISQFHVDAVIFTGVAGALAPQLTIGDVVISTACLQHDMDVTALGFGRGIIPFSAISTFEASERLITAAEASCSGLFPGHYYKGLVLSGDQFIANRETVLDLFHHFNGICVEMEGSSVAQTCVLNQVPYVVIRSISDKADGSAHMNFAEFTELAASHSAQIVAGMLKHL